MFTAHNTQQQEVNMIALGYIRISPRGSNYQGVSLEVQAAAIKNYCTYKGIELAAIYGDKFISGKKLSSRPGANAMLEIASERKIDLVITYKLDRFMRNTIETLDTINFLEDRGIKFVSLSEEINTQTATGKFFLTIVAALAQMEREQVSERTKDALGKLKSDGLVYCKVPEFGLMRIKGSKKLFRNYRAKALYDRHMELREAKVPYQLHGQILYSEGFKNANGRPYSVSDLFRIRCRIKYKPWDVIWADYPEPPENFEEHQLSA